MHTCYGEVLGVAPWEVVLELRVPSFLRCAGVGVKFACQQRGGCRAVCAGRRLTSVVCMVTRALLFEHPLESGVAGSDCRYLNGNAITELAATLFDKLINLQTLYVTLQSAIHASGGEGCWALHRGRLSLN